MTETENVATYARVRPYNPAINEDKRLTARCAEGKKILNMNGNNEDTYNFTKVFDMKQSTNDAFENGMKPLLDFKILQGINSIFIVYGQSGSGKSFTLIGEPGHLGVLPMSLQYLLKQDKVESVHIASIEAYGIKATKIGFYDLVHQLKEKQKAPKKFDAYSSKDNSRVNSSNAERIEITASNCLSVITELQEASHMAPTLKNPHSSRGHTVYFSQIKMTGLEDVYFIAVDLAGSEGQTALGTQDEFMNGLKLAMSKGKLELNKKQMKGFEQMYKTRSLEAGCINNGLTQLQTIFSELIRKKISKAQGLGLRKVLSSFISLNSAYAIMFTLSASANNNKVTRATLNFAKQTQLVKVDTKKAKTKIDKDAIIKELKALIQELQKGMAQKNNKIKELKDRLSSAQITTPNALSVPGNNGSPAFQFPPNATLQRMSSVAVLEGGTEVFKKYEELTRQITAAEEEDAKWNVSDEMLHAVDINEDEMKGIFDEFDEDGGGSIDAEELQHALHKMGHDMTMDEVNELIQEIDVNGDGEVDYDEFKVMADKTWFVGAFQSKLVQSMERMMGNMIMDDDDKEDEEEFDDFEPHELVEEINVRKQTIMDLQNELSQMKELTMIEDVEEGDVEELMDRIRLKNNMIEELEDKMVDNERRHYDELERLQKEIAHLMTDRLEHSNQLMEKNEMQQSLDELHGNVDGMKKENDQLQSDIHRFEHENGDLRNGIDAVKHSYDELKHSLSVIENENKELKRNEDRKKHENENDINRLQNKNKELQSVMNGLKQEFEQLKEGMNGLQNENIKLNDDVSGLRTDFKSLTISKINMIEECNEQLNLLRNGIRIYQKKTTRWMPFSVDLKWDN